MENITENNKLIAEFMGYKYIGFNNDDNLKPGWWKNNNDLLKIQSQEIFNRKLGKSNFLCRKHNELRYYNSWNWLMEVVEKIEKEFCSTNIHYYSQKQMYSVEFLGFNIEYDNSEFGDDKMKILYNSCVNFINFYNKRKEGEID